MCHEIELFFRRHIGRSQAPANLVEWLFTQESRLAAATNGHVFHDPCGDFSRIRSDLRAFYPEDVRRKKIAARAAVMAQSGQYNYARCLCRKEVAAARLALGEFITSTISMVFLLNRRYMPFYKWMHRAMRDLPDVETLSELVRELSLGDIDLGAWQFGTPKEMLTVLNEQDRNVAIIERICGIIKMRLQQEGLTDSDDDFLAIHAEQVMQRIDDRTLRSLHITEG